MSSRSTPVDKPGALHRLDRFLAAAGNEGFMLEENLDVTRQAAPTIDYFLERIPRHRASIERDLGLEPAQLDGLLASGSGYREMYRSGVYGYRLVRFRS